MSKYLVPVAIVLAAGATSSAFAQTVATINAAGVRIENGRFERRTSAPGTILPYGQYRYNIDLIVRGRGLFSILSFLIPSNRPLATVITDLGGDPADILTGDVVNLSGTHPFQVFNEIIDGGDIVATIRGGIDANSVAYFEVTDVTITSGWGYIEVISGTVTLEHIGAPPATGACCLPAGGCSIQTLAQCDNVRGTWSGAGTNCGTTTCPNSILLYSQNFETVVLGPNVDEVTAGTNVWSSTFPAGWVVDRTGVPTGGVTEWRGWNVANRAWWSTAAANQNRSQFTKGVGAVAVADSDEYADLPSDPGTYSTSISTPAISLAGIQANSARIAFDSSWRPEGNQLARISVSYDGAAPVVLDTWTSVAGPDFKPDATNETVTLALNNPAGAQSAVVTFFYGEASNNWWWAIDNLEVFGVVAPPPACPADYNGDTGVDGDDVIAFFADWDGGVIGADFNGDGGVDGDDVIDFFARWDSGC
ncbi:MAG: GC-type dockerin domain-anchored protein [Phycisphaerales bacterium]